MFAKIGKKPLGVKTEACTVVHYLDKPGLFNLLHFCKKHAAEDCIQHKIETDAKNCTLLHILIEIKSSDFE